MKKQVRLESNKKRERLEGVKYGFSKKQKAAIKRMFPLYLCTALAIVFCVTMLLVFGVNSNGRPMLSSTPLSKIADKAAGLFAWIDFPSGVGSDTVYTPSVDTVLPPSSQSPTTPPSQTQKPSENVSVSNGSIYDFDYSLVPDGHIPIIPMDLSLSQYGSAYINNSTGYSPDIMELINKNLKENNGIEQMSASNEPIVLIVHTHGTESYSPEGALGAPEGGESVRNNDTQKNVVAIGKTVADILNKNGVPTAHCTVMHDSIQYKDSYSRAEETIRKYLAEFPSIRLVIDIHRDSIIKSSGELVKPIAELDGKGAAQLMCVVGSDWEGEKCPQWENNLSLALKLRENLNDECENICRPVFLKSHTYNQEIAPYSLLIEVGSSGNSMAEAQRSAELLARELCELIKEI